MSDNISYVVYLDHQGLEHVETVTSPISQVLREEELANLGYRVVH